MSKPVVQVFSATLARDRDRVGDLVTDWLRANPQVAVSEIRTHQSSDNSYHCLTFIIFGAEP